MAERTDARGLTPPVENVVVDIPGWQQVRPRIPDTQQRRTLEKRRSIREIVFGVQDGILTTLGIITGVGVAEGDRSAVFISGFLALLAGALSMGVGEYLGSKSEREVVQATIDMEKREMAEDPQGEFSEQVAYYKLKGFRADEAEMIVRRLTQHPEIYLYEMVRDEFGIDPREAEGSGLRAPVAIGGSFAIGSLVPILAFMLPLSIFASTLASLLFALIGLFAVGYFAGTLSERNPSEKVWRSRFLDAASSNFISRRSLHTAALRPRTRFGRRVMPLALGHALIAGIAQAAAFFWDSLFGLIFGFLVSAVVQVRLTPAMMHRYLGPGFKGLLYAAGFGIISSACSYGAAAAARGFYRRGADARSVFAFLISSTNMNLAILILFWSLLGWKFAFAEFFGGIIIIAIVTTGFTLFFRGGELARLQREYLQMFGPMRAKANATSTATVHNDATDGMPSRQPQ